MENLAAVPACYIRKDNNSSDIQVLHQIFVQEQYKPCIEFLGDFKPRTIVDAGANIGMAALYFHSVFPEALIMCVEPDHDNFRVLYENTFRLFSENLHAATWTYLINCAIWPKEQILKVENNFRDKREWSRTVAPYLSPTDRTVLGLPFTEIINNFNSFWPSKKPFTGSLDLLKLDVEGTEDLLFSDYDQASKILFNVKALFIEIHEEFNCKERILGFLDAFGFDHATFNETTVAKRRDLIV